MRLNRSGLFPPPFFPCCSTLLRGSPHRLLTIISSFND
ncbi:hypothetical protein VPH1256_0074 [Vibrio phage 1256]